ncbi:hypothetical protein GHT06_010067 [Daphnia sinensis]|uniref:histone acetyltransferase n=1 Tax=Daphnia sinensis TaxID=1820382 RepID=A0AAD5LHW2_9CRUS|nr:hypothetical protein GHT06_010067 [Daphnia sinensis]
MSNKNNLSNKSSFSDGEFISCENCLVLFEKDEIEQKPHQEKGCHHFFCTPCIQSLTSSDTRILTNCSRCNFSEKKSKKHKSTCWNDANWCSNCNLPASGGCHEGKHMIENANALYTACSQQLKVLSDKTNNACEHALRDCHKIKSAHEVILAWISWLQQKISLWNSSNIDTIAQLESLKATMGVHIPPKKDVSTTINRTKQQTTEFQDKLQLARTTQAEVNNVFQMYRNVRCETAVSAQLSGFTETPSDPVNWFSTTLGHSNKACMDVLSFLVRFLDREQAVSGNIPGLSCSSNKDAVINQGSQTKNNNSLGNSEKISGKDEARLSCEDNQRILKRRLDEARGSSTPLNKKVRLQTPDRENNKDDRDDLTFDGADGNAVNLILQAKMGLQVATANEKFFQSMRAKLESAENKLKLMEEKVAILTKEKSCQSVEKTNQIVRFENDVTLVVEKFELAKDSGAIAHQESSILFKLTKETREKYAMMLVLSTADVEQLHVVRKQLEASQSGLAIVLQERTNQATPEEIEKPKIDGALVAKRYNQLLKKMEKMKEVVTKSKKQLTEAQNSNAELVWVQIGLQEEVRKAKEESEKLRSKMIAADANRAEELNLLRNYKTHFDELKVEVEKLIAEKATSFTVPIAANNNEEQHLIIAGYEQVKQTTPSEDSTRKSAMQTLPQVAIVQHTEPRKVVPNPIMPQKIKQLQVCNFNAIASDVLVVLHCQGTDLRYDVCTICKSKVETRFHCAKCKYFILCVPCYQTGKHHHKMDVLGFDLDVQELPAGFKDIEEARKSKIDRRISSLLHSFQCHVANCREPYCKSMKLIISHNITCKFKAAKSLTESNLDAGSSCPTCTELVSLIIYHAKLCTNPTCSVPHCSSAKRNIKSFQHKLLTLQKAEREEHNKEPSTGPMSPLMWHNVNPVPSEESLNSYQQQERETLNVATDIGLRATQPIAHVAPYVAGSATKTGTIRPTLSDANKRNIVRENIILILHAHQCQRGRNQCPIPHCQAMKNVLHHVRTCQSVKPCVPHCRSSRIIIHHLKNCHRGDCLYCLAMTEVERYDAITGPNPIIIASEPQSTNMYNATERVGNLVRIRDCSPGPSEHFSRRIL